MNKERFKRRIRKITAFAAAMAMSASIMLSDGIFGNFGITAFADGYGTFGNSNSLEWMFYEDENKLTIDYKLGTNGGMMNFWESASNVPWYKYRTNINSVRISDKVTSIGNYAFNGYSNLKNVTIFSYANGEGVITYIGPSAFEGCTSLESIDIRAGVQNIDNRAFANCTSLTSVSVPSTVTRLGSSVFERCISLESAELPNNLTSTGSATFNGCTNLKSVNIPSKATSIDSYFLSGCSSLTSITIPKTVTTIGMSAFAGCSGLTGITIPYNVTSIGAKAFYGCSGIKSFSIPENVTYIGENAFSGCSGITRITIPQKVTTIGNNAFENCSGLEAIFIPSSLNVSNAGIPSTTTQIRYTVGEDGKASVTDVTFGTGSTAFTIPQSIGNATIGAVYIKDGKTGITSPNAPLIEYRVNNSEATITKIVLPTGQKKFNLPDNICGYPIAAVASDYQQYVGIHNHIFDSNNICTLCGRGMELTISGSGLIYGTDYSIDSTSNTLTILSDKPITISGESNNSIVVKKDVNANITFDGLTIDVSDTPTTLTKCAFKIEDNSTGDVTITLAEGTTNTLYSCFEGCAALQKNGSGDNVGKLEIKGEGILTVKGGKQDAGIGGSYNQSTANITISGGTITAIGGSYGAGIGVGYGGSASNITISGGTVIATGGYYGGAGIGGGYGGNAANITISGGTVTATSKGYGAGIGGGKDGSAANIIISGGSVKASSIGCTPTDGTDNVYPLTISNPDSKPVTINGKAYTPVNHKAADPSDGNLYIYHPKTASDNNVVVKVGDEEIIYTFDEFSKWGKLVENVTLSIDAPKAGVALASNAACSTEGISTTAPEITWSPSDTIALPNTVYTAEVTLQSADIYAVSSSTAVKININGIEKDGTVNYTDGKFKVSYTFDETEDLPMDLTIFETGTGNKLISGTDYVYEKTNHVLTIMTEKGVTVSGTTTADQIAIANGISANITLYGVNIDVSGTTDACAFKIADNSTGDVTITLAEGTTNTLKSGNNCAGLQKNGNGDNVGTLEIKGEGSLSAAGGKYGAGIGGGDNVDTANITISGGNVTANGGNFAPGIGGCNKKSTNITISGSTVTATGGGYGAGIGSGHNGGTANITISDSTVIANGGEYGAGVGSGNYGSWSNITISDSKVTATGNKYSAGIGGGNNGSGSHITISDSIVTATGGEDGAGIGGGKEGSGSDIIISGGSVKASSISCIPTNGTEEVFLITTSNPDSKEVFIDGSSYTPINHKAIDSNDGNLYLYVNGVDHFVTIGDAGYLYEFDPLLKRFVKKHDNEFEVKAANSVETLIEGTDYTYKYGILTVLSDKAMVISGTTTIDTIVIANDVSANITLDGVNIDVSGTSGECAFKIADDSKGNVTIDLKGENTLISGENCAGLQKNGDYISESEGKLTIKSESGTGKLTAKGGKNSAGIGSIQNSSCSNIEISGGTITANCGSESAGIGGGYGGSCSHITISGGTVTATGGNKSAGIGGSTKSSSSHITISGGAVTAIGGYRAAGIGCGGDWSESSNITISGGTVTVTGGEDGAGIGGGYYGNVSNITISGGTVTATGNRNGAGIGCGSDGSGSNITISGGTVTATGNTYGAGIGGGGWCDGTNITISGGTVIAKGGNYAAGIGGGYHGSGSNITISGSIVTATGGYKGVGIGGGYNGSGSNITISGGSVKASSIGCTPTNGTENVYLITISNPYSKEVLIDGRAYTPVNHKALDSNDGNLYAYLPAKTVNDPLVVKAGGKTAYYYYDTTSSAWVQSAQTAIIDVPDADSTAFTYTGSEQIYNIEESENYTVSGNKQTNAGTYTVTVSLKNKNITQWSSGSTDDIEFEFVINKAIPVLNAPTATAISYGEALSASKLSDTNWRWVDGTVIPNVKNSGYAAKMTVDDSNYDYTDVEGYDSENHTVTRTIAVTVNKGTPSVTPPTATAITYGDTLAQSTLTEGWTWVDNTIKPDINNSGFKAYKTVTDYENYDYSNLAGFDYDEETHKLSCTVAVTVNKASASEITTPTATAITYGQKLSASTLSDKNWSWVDGTVIPTVKNSGYAAKMTVDDINYDYSGIAGYDSTEHTVTRTISVTVTPAQAKVVTAPAAIEKLVFNGTAKALVSAGTASGGTMVYSLDGETFTEAIPTATAAGTYTVYYKVSGDENHTDSEAGQVSVTIESAAEIITGITVSKTAVVVTYGYEGTTITARTENVAFANVTVEMVEWMKNSNIQLVIDFVNYSTAGSDTVILTDPQIKAIEYVLEHDFGIAA